jgi:hypothetical protein
MLRLPFSDRVAPRTMGPRDREFLVTTGLMVAGAAVLFGLDATARHEVFLGWFWPWWWAIAGLSSVAYGMRPRSADLHAFSRAALTVSAVSRGVQLTLSVLLESTPGDRVLRTLAGALVYLLLGRLIYRQWMTLMPIHEARDAGSR